MKPKSLAITLFPCLLLVFVVCGCVDDQVAETDGSGIQDSEDIQEGDGTGQDGEGVSPGEDKHAYITVDNSNFDELVLKSDKPVMVDFWAPWCGPCRVIAPAVEELAAEYAGRAVVAKVNVDDAPELAEKYQVSGIPMLIFIRNGQQVDEIVGARPKDEIEARLAAVTADPALPPDTPEPSL